MELDIIYNPYAGGEKRMKKNLALAETTFLLFSAHGKPEFDEVNAASH